MATYRETSRGVSAGCDIELDYQFLLYAPGQAFIDEDGYVDGTVGGTSGHMAWGGTWTWSKFSQSSGMLNWAWEIRLTLTADNGHGTTNSTTIVVDSGTEPNTTTSISRTGTVTGTWSGSGTVDVLWDISEVADPATLEYPTWPRQTTLDWYERSQASSTQTSTLTLGGTSCTATGSVSATQRRANYTFVATLDGFAQEGASGSGTLTNVVVNNIAPAYATHSHTSNSQTVGNWSVDVTSGPTQTNTAELSASARLRSTCTMRTVARAWDGAYPDALSWRITGFDPVSPGYRDVTATGSFAETETYDQYDFDSEIVTTVGGTSTLSTSLDELTDQIYAYVQTASLVSAGDDTATDRVLLRGWRFDGFDLVSTNNRSITGTGNDRTYTPYEGMSGYRYLDVQIKAQSGSNVPGVIELTDFHGNTKRWNVTAATTSYATVTIDLCSPDVWSVGGLPATDGKDDPYPRINTANTSYAGNESVDSAYWGVTSCRRLRVSSGSIDIGTTTLKYTNSDSTYVPSGSQHRVERITKAQVSESGTTTTYYTRRFWQQDRDGRIEEEGDLWWQKTVGGETGVTSYAIDPLTISELADQINASDNSVVRHPGWTATNSVAYPGAGTCSVTLPPLTSCYLNGETGYATWLWGAGIIAKPHSTSGTDFVYGHQYAGTSPNTVITAQTLFDRINGDFPPDRDDPFGVNAGNDTGLYLCGGTIYRGIAHGGLLDAAGDPQTLGTVTIKRSSDNAVRGTDSTIDAAGRYYTGTPWALGEVDHYIEYQSDTINVVPMRTSKRQRGWFRPATTAGGGIRLAVSPTDRVTRGYSDGSPAVLVLGFASAPVAVDWVDYPTTLQTEDFWIDYTRTGSTSLVIAYVDGSGNVQRTTTTDEGETFAVATTIFTSAKHPCFVVSPTGVEYHFAWFSGGTIKTRVYDAQGVEMLALTTVVASGVDDDQIAAEWRDGYVLLGYVASGAVTIVKSQDGEVYS